MPYFRRVMISSIGSEVVKEQLTMKFLQLKGFKNRLGNHLPDCVCASVFLISVTSLRNQKFSRLGDCFVWHCFVIVLVNSPV